jgi:hypothetical protein
MTGADEMRLILANSADVFSAGAVSKPCIVETFDEEVPTDQFGGAKQLITRTFALVCWDDFQSLSEDDQVSVNGTAYTVLNVRRIHDGHALQVNLKKVS